MMILFVFIGLFGNVTLNGEVVQNKVISLIISIVVFPIIIIILGIVMNFLKECILAFLKESKAKLTKKPL